MDTIQLKERTRNFFSDLALPVSTFSRHVELSRSSVYRWLRDELDLSQSAMTRINEFLKKYGF